MDKEPDWAWKDGPVDWSKPMHFAKTVFNSPDPVVIGEVPAGSTLTVADLDRMLEKAMEMRSLIQPINGKFVIEMSEEEAWRVSLLSYGWYDRYPRKLKKALHGRIPWRLRERIKRSDWERRLTLPDYIVLS